MDLEKNILGKDSPAGQASACMPAHVFYMLYYIALQYVCMYVCMYVCKNVCMYVHIYGVYR
jgi:hypothetical protein